MPVAQRTGLFEAASFLPPEVQRALVRDPTGKICRALPVRKVALLWCDIVGFSGHTARVLSDGPNGAERLHGLLSRHYDELLAQISRYNRQPQLAQQYYRNALEIYRRELGTVHPDVDAVLFAMGQTEQQTGNPQNSIPYYQEAIMCSFLLA